MCNLNKVELQLIIDSMVQLLLITFYRINKAKKKKGSFKENGFIISIHKYKINDNNEIPFSISYAIHYKS